VGLVAHLLLLDVSLVALLLLLLVLLVPLGLRLGVPLGVGLFRLVFHARGIRAHVVPRFGESAVLCGIRHHLEAGVGTHRVEIVVRLDQRMIAEAVIERLLERADGAVAMPGEREAAGCVVPGFALVEAGARGALVGFARVVEMLGGVLVLGEGVPLLARLRIGGTEFGIRLAGSVTARSTRRRRRERLAGADARPGLRGRRRFGASRL